MNYDGGKENIEHRFFLVGCARSGTTLLQSLLAAHPDVISFPESHFFTTLTPHATWRKRLGLANPRIKKHLENFYDEIGREDGTRVSPGVFTIGMRRYALAFIRTLDNKAIAQETSNWLEKTPIHLHHITQIERYVPNSQIIHLVRDGRDVVASMHKITHRHPEVWDGARTIEECIHRWTGDIQRTRRHTGKPGHHVVRYRDIASNPENTLRRLCLSLGINYSENMIEEYQVEGEAVSRGAGEWKKPTESIRYKGQEKFEQYFNQSQKSRIENAVCSYDLDALTTV